MGNASTVQQLEVAIPSYVGEWKHESSVGHCSLVRNVDTGVVAEQYSIPTDPRIERGKDYWIYEMRRTQRDNIVTVYQVEKEEGKYMCQGVDYLRVKTEHIPYRLSEISNISFTEAVYILKEALIGFRAIADFCGPIRVTDEMIGFTPEHKVKVWLNQNFACNLPSEGQEFQLRQPSSLEQRDPHTIAQVFEVVEEHMSEGAFPQSFSRAFRQYPMQTFSEAIQFVQEYSSKERIQEKESLAKEARFINQTNTVSRVKSSAPQPPVAGQKVEGERCLMKDGVKRYVVEGTIDQSQIGVQRTQPEKGLIKAQNILSVGASQVRVISSKHQVPQQYYYEPRPLKLAPQILQSQQVDRVEERIPVIIRESPMVRIDKSRTKSQVVIAREPSNNYQYISSINNHPANTNPKNSLILRQPEIRFSKIPEVPPRFPISQYQDIADPTLIPNQKLSTTTVHSQSSLVSNPPLPPPRDPYLIPRKNPFTRKPKNITADSIPSKYLPRPQLNFLSPRK